MNRIIDCLIAFAVGFLLAIGVCIYRPTQPSPPSAPAPVARELKGQPTTIAECRPVVIYLRAKKDLGLPPAVLADDKRQVVGAAQVPAADHPHTVSAVANLETGVVDLYVRPDPLPWLAFERRTTFGVIAGVNEEGAQMLRATGQIDLLRSRNAHLGAAVHADTAGHVLAGIALTFR